MILGKYHLPATCHRTMPSWESCRFILYDMSADKVPRVFGPSSDPTVTENLPHRIYSGEWDESPPFCSLCVLTTSFEKADLKCSATVFTNGRPDVLSYYEIWEAVVAIFSVCTRYGKTGSLRGLGKFLGNYMNHSRATRLRPA